MTHVLLPISKKAFEEIAEQVRLRGQPERVDGNKIWLTDVALESNEAAMIKDETEAKRRRFIP